MHSPPRRRLFDAFVWIALASLILVTAAHLITKPPAMPAYTDVRADWTPSEAWLYDRDGRLLDTERVDFQRRRLGWVRSDEHTSELQSLMRISYAVFCLKKK